MSSTYVKFRICPHKHPDSPHGYGTGHYHEKIDIEHNFCMTHDALVKRFMSTMADKHEGFTATQDLTVELHDRHSGCGPELNGRDIRNRYTHTKNDKRERIVVHKTVFVDFRVDDGSRLPWEPLHSPDNDYKDTARGLYRLRQLEHVTSKVPQKSLGGRRHAPGKFAGTGQSATSARKRAQEGRKVAQSSNGRKRPLVRGSARVAQALSDEEDDVQDDEGERQEQQEQNEDDVGEEENEEVTGFTERYDPLELVRVGRQVDQDDTPTNGIPMKAIIVAAIRGEGDGRGIAFLLVQTWKLCMPQCIGDYNNAEVFQAVDDIPNFDADNLDQYWKDRITDEEEFYQVDRLERAVLEYLDNDSEEPVDDQDSLDLDPSAATPISAPLRLAHKDKETLHEAYDDEGDDQPDDLERDIAAVITFANTVTDSALGTPTNLQALLDWDESLETFRAYVCHAMITEMKSGRLKNLLRHRNFPWWTIFEIWVLPQWSRELLRWDRDGNNVQLRACDFLGAQVETAYPGRRIYVEIRILEHPGAALKDNAWVAHGHAYAEDRCPTYGWKRSIGDSEDELDDDETPMGRVSS